MGRPRWSRSQKLEVSSSLAAEKNPKGSSPLAAKRGRGRPPKQPKTAVCPAGQPETVDCPDDQPVDLQDHKTDSKTIQVVYGKPVVQSNGLDELVPLFEPRQLVHIVDDRNQNRYLVGVVMEVKDNGDLRVRVIEGVKHQHTSPCTNTFDDDVGFMATFTFVRGIYTVLSREEILRIAFF